MSGPAIGSPATGSPVAQGDGEACALVPPHRYRWWAVGLALAPFVALVARFWFVGDDAYISMRYARNLAEGLGLAYNPGTSPPVEGYSEFLWVLWLALLELVHAPVVALAPLTSAVCGVVLVARVVRYLDRFVAHENAALFGAALFVGTLVPLAVWSTGGMGTMPALLAVWWVFESLLGAHDVHRGASAAVAGSLLVLLRADGALWVFLLAGTAWAIGRARRDPCLTRAARLGALVPLAVFVAHVGFRLAVHGDWLPNTARAKVGMDAFTLERGARYVGSALLTFPGIGLAIALPLAFGRRCLERPTLSALLGIAATAAYAVWVGGDFMCFGRFLLPALPFAAVLLAKGLQALSEDGRGRLVVGLAAAIAALDLLPAFDVHPVPRSVRARLHFRFNNPAHASEFQQWSDMKLRAEEWTRLGRALGEVCAPGESLVLGAIGAVGYHSRLRIFDRFGLVSPEVLEAPPLEGRRSPGHDRAVQREFFLDRDPTYLDAWLDRAERLEGKRLPDGLLADPLDPERFGPGWVLLRRRPGGTGG